MRAPHLLHPVQSKTSCLDNLTRCQMLSLTHCRWRWQTHNAAAPLALAWLRVLDVEDCDPRPTIILGLRRRDQGRSVPVLDVGIARGGTHAGREAAARAPPHACLLWRRLTSQASTCTRRERERPGAAPAEPARRARTAA